VPEAIDNPGELEGAAPPRLKESQKQARCPFRPVNEADYLGWARELVIGHAS